VLRVMHVLIGCALLVAGAGESGARGHRATIEDAGTPFLRPCAQSPDLCKFLGTRLYQGHADYRRSGLRPGEELLSEVVGSYGAMNRTNKRRLLGYQGVTLPVDRSKSANLRRRAPRRGGLSWVGFEEKKAFSRVFWRLSDPATPVQVDRVDALNVWVRFPRSVVKAPTMLRPLDTRAFTGPIASVRTEVSPHEVVFRIRLKRPVQHLYRFEGSFLMVDFER
jgi:hypothetical protein